MSKYFDKDFFKFFWGFLAIIVVSLIFIILGKMYENMDGDQTTDTIDVSQSGQ